MRMLDDHVVIVYGGTQLLKQSNATSVHLSWHLCITGTGENIRLNKPEVMHVVLCHKEHHISCLDGHVLDKRSPQSVGYWFHFYLPSPRSPWQTLQQRREHYSQVWRYKGAGLFGN